MSVFEEIYEKIKEAPVITLFRHTEPDMDSLGSQAGMKKALEALFPEKQIFMLGEQTRDGFVMDVVDDDVVKNSLGILLDASNSERIDDKRFFETADSVRMDHHIKTEDIAKLDYVDEKAGATGEILALFFRDLGLDIPAEAAQDLYQALTADTARFTTSNTRPESLEAGAYLLKQGASVVRTDQVNNGISMADFKYGALIRRKATTCQKLLFAVMSKTDWMTFGLESSRAAKKAFMLAGVQEMEIWALFTEDSDGLFNASLRSRTREVRDIAMKYGGGGHECAAGIGKLTASQVTDIIRQLAARSVETEEEKQLRLEKRQEEEAKKLAEEEAQAAQEAVNEEAKPADLPALPTEQPAQ